jgi:hypothetical protein
MASISSFPIIRREHILCDWKAPRLGQEIHRGSLRRNARGDRRPVARAGAQALKQSRISALTWPSDPPAVTACAGARQAVG